MLRSSSSSSSSSSFWEGNNETMMNSEYLIIPMIRRVRVCDFDEQVKLLTVLRRRGERSERCRRLIEDSESWIKAWHGNDDEMRGHVLQVLLTERIGTGRPRLDMDRTIRHLLATKRTNLLRYALTSDPERVQGVVSIVNRHSNIDKQVAKEIMEYASTYFSVKMLLPEKQIEDEVNTTPTTIQLSQSDIVKKLQHICGAPETITNTTELLEQCCTKVKDHNKLELVFQSFRTLRLDKTNEAIDLVLKLSYTVSSKSKTRNLCLDFLQYLIENTAKKIKFILKTCALFPYSKLCVCEALSSTNTARRNCEEWFVLKDLVARCPILARSSLEMICSTKDNVHVFSRLACLVAILEASYKTFTFEDLDTALKSLFRILRHVFKSRRMFEHGTSHCFSNFILNVLSFVRVLGLDDRGGPGMCFSSLLLSDLIHSIAQ